MRKICGQTEVSRKSPELSQEGGKKKGDLGSKYGSKGRLNQRIKVIEGFPSKAERISAGKKGEQKRDVENFATKRERVSKEVHLEKGLREEGEGGKY